MRKSLEVTKLAFYILLIVETSLSANDYNSWMILGSNTLPSCSIAAAGEF